MISTSGVDLGVPESSRTTPEVVAKVQSPFKSRSRMYLSLLMKRVLLAALLVSAPVLVLADQSGRVQRPENGGDLATAKPGRDPNQPIDEEYTKKIKEYTTEPFFLSPLVDYLPGVEDRADAEGRARRHRRRAGQAAVHEGSARLHAAAREGHAAREGVLDRHERRRARDDRGGRRVRGADGAARREQGGPRSSSPTRARSR